MGQDSRARLRVSSVAAIAVGGILIGYELYLWSQTNDPIEKLAHIENSFAIGIDAGISIIPLYGIAVELTWGLVVYASAWIGSLLGFAPNELALQIVSSPGSTIVFLIEYIWGGVIPSAVANDALNRLMNSLADAARYSNGLTPPRPTILLVP